MKNKILIGTYIDHNLIKCSCGSTGGLVLTPLDGMKTEYACEECYKVAYIIDYSDNSIKFSKDCEVLSLDDTRVYNKLQEI